jgi:hypothetical protein
MGGSFIKMKKFIADILTFVLSKMNVSVIIGCEIKGDVIVKNNNQYFYNNNLSEAKMYYNNGQQFKLPEGKFKIKSELNNNGKYEVYYRKTIEKTH